MPLTLNGATSLYFIVGDPIAQVRAPEALSQAMQAQGLNALMVPAHVQPENLNSFFKTVREMQNCQGICVTIPHKFAARDFCYEVSDRSALLQVVNVMRKTPQGFSGDMVDGAGFCDALRLHTGEIKGKRALLAGAGGAGSAIALELLTQGVRELYIHDEDATRRDALIKKLNGRAKIGSSNPTGFDLICNATPAGMQPQDKPPFNLDNLTPAMQVGCVVTKPALTPFIAFAREKGCKTATGGDMYNALQAMMLRFFTQDL
jgi:shikimate dehydrogenase